MKFEAFYSWVMDDEEPDEMLADLESQSMSNVVTAQKLTELRVLFDKIMTPKKDTNNPDI